MGDTRDSQNHPQTPQGLRRDHIDPIPAPRACSPWLPTSGGPCGEHECGETSVEIGQIRVTSHMLYYTKHQHQRPLRGPLQQHGTGLRAVILRFYTVSTETRPSPGSRGRELAELQNYTRPCPPLSRQVYDFTVWLRRVASDILPPSSDFPSAGRPPSLGVESLSGQRKTFRQRQWLLPSPPSHLARLP